MLAELLVTLLVTAITTWLVLVFFILKDKKVYDIYTQPSEYINNAEVGIPVICYLAD